jgi:hypothetical protein
MVAAYDSRRRHSEKYSRTSPGAVFGIKGSFLFTSLRGHPRFIALLEKMKLA